MPSNLTLFTCARSARALNRTGFHLPLPFIPPASFRRSMKFFTYSRPPCTSAEMLTFPSEVPATTSNDLLNAFPTPDENPSEKHASLQKNTAAEDLRSTKSHQETPVIPPILPNSTSSYGAGKALPPLRYSASSAVNSAPNAPFPIRVPWCPLVVRNFSWITSTL